MFRFRTIKSKLLLSFSIFIGITILLILISIEFGFRRDRIENALLLLNRINTEIEEIAKLERTFLDDEMINPQFHQSGKSSFISNRRDKVKLIKDSLNVLQKIIDIRDLEIKKDIDQLSDELDNYEIIFDTLVTKVLKKGFKDYGIVGEMRTYVHAIEDTKIDIIQTSMLMLRRHEKDFIIRKDTIYVRKHQKKADDFYKEIQNLALSSSVKEKLLSDLYSYQRLFQEMAQIEQEIGFSNNEGLKKDLEHSSIEITKNIQYINEVISKQAKEEQARSRIYLLSIGSFTFLLVIFLSFYITRVLSNPIQKLSYSINQVVSQKFSDEVEVATINSQDEIGFLAKDFDYMLRVVKDSLYEIKEKSRKLQKKQKLLVDSISYAQQIQQAILPDENELKLLSDNYFIIYLPMHTVSGDFYWFYRKPKQFFVAVVDCTGHGVPGAFMSMIGNTLLNKIVSENEINDPAFILEVLHLEVVMALHQDNARNQDGMELGLCIIEPIDNDQFKVKYSGAKSALYYSLENTVEVIKGTKRAIGGGMPIHHNKPFTPFESNDIILNKGDKIYLMSDGFADQPNRKRKKYGTKRIHKLLQQILHLPMMEQKKILLESLEGHTNMKTDQRDDITLMGLEL